MKRPHIQEVRTLFGKNVRRFRLLKDKTQETLAEDIGVTHVHISRIENGLVTTSIYHLYLISQVLDVPASDFFKKH